MKILVISQYYPPESATIAPAIARGLAGKGHEVRVLTGYPNYPKGIIFDGYKQKWRQFEADEDIQVLRVPLYANHSMNPLARTLNYVSFALSSATARKFAKDVDVIYVYATQMTPAFGPWLWRKFGGAPFVLHIQDLWPDSIIGSSMVRGAKKTKLIEALLSPWLGNVYKSAAGVIGIAPTMVKTLVKRGVPAPQSTLIYNWSDDSAAELRVDEKARDRSNINILYAGNVGDMQDLETVVRAALRLKESSLKFTIVGDGVALERIQLFAEEMGALNIEFRGRVPRAEMSAIYNEADFALVTLKDLPVFRGTIPSKFQASIAHGVPVITTVQGDLKGIVERLKVGLVAEPENPDSLASAFRIAEEISSDEYNRLRERTRQVYLDHFSCASGVGAVETVLSRAVEKDSRRHSRSA